MTRYDDTPLETAQACRAWPFEEAKAVLKRLLAIGKGQIQMPEKGYILFETGYGPSGLPHIGTFGEVARTTMVMQAFQRLSDIPAKLVCFSDDMDALRKVPGNIPNQDMLAPCIGVPLSSVPNPFDSDYDSFSAHNNACLRDFLDSFGFEYEFLSATECYKDGRFDGSLKIMLEKYEEVRQAVLPILGEERAATYSPLLPLIKNKTSGTPIILHNATIETVIDADKGMVQFKVLDDSELDKSGYGAGEVFEHCILSGGCKAQWRADWALRWHALDVDYEMAGKDLKSSADISGKITQILGGRKPAGFHYELFLDEKGEKISKSKGNGLSMDEWLRYAPPESLSYYMFQRPTSAKKLYFDVIPKAVDEYLTFIDKFNDQDPDKKLENPVWHIHNGRLPNSAGSPLSFALLLNLVNAANTDDPKVLWKFIRQYAPDASPDSAPFLDTLTRYAIQYYKDFVLPEKTYRMPDEREDNALKDLAGRLKSMQAGQEPETYMEEVFSAGKENGYDKSELREWFQAIYQILLGHDQGPRFGSFIALYGPQETATLIEEALAGKFAKAA